MWCQLLMTHLITFDSTENLGQHYTKMLSHKCLHVCHSGDDDSVVLALLDWLGKQSKQQTAGSTKGSAVFFWVSGGRRQNQSGTVFAFYWIWKMHVAAAFPHGTAS